MSTLWNKIRLKILAVSLVLISGNGFAQSDTLSFLHITDMHLIFQWESLRPELANNRSGYSVTIQPLADFFQSKPQQTNSDWVIATGDLIDFYEGQIADRSMMDFQIEQFVRLSSTCRVPVFCALGNHDVISYAWGNDQRVSTQNYAEKARASWIRNAPCFQDGTYYSKDFNVDGTDFRFIFLDDAYYDFEDHEETEPYLELPQLKWLEGQINESSDDIEIVLMHIPLEEETTQPGNEVKLYSLLKEYPSVKMIMAGHRHKNVIKTFRNGDSSEIIQVQTGGFANDSEKNWRQIKLTGNQIIISAPGSTDKEFEIELDHLKILKK